MRKLSRAWKTLAFVVGCGAAALGGVAVRARTQGVLLVVGQDTRCPWMRDEGALPFGRLRTARPVCAPIDGGDVVAVELDAPRFPGHHYGHLRLDLRRGELRTDWIVERFSDQHGCAVAESAWPFVQALLTLTPRSTWREAPASLEPSSDPFDGRWRITWHTAAGAQFRFAIEDTAIVQGAVGALVRATPSSAHQAREIETQRGNVGAVSFVWRNRSCFHCGGDTFVRGTVYEDGVYVVEGHNDDLNLLDGGRVAVDDAQAFARWLRARGWGRTTWDDKGKHGGRHFNRACSTHPPARAWVTALGVDLIWVTDRDDVAPGSATP